MPAACFVWAYYQRTKAEIAPPIITTQRIPTFILSATNEAIARRIADKDHVVVVAKLIVANKRRPIKEA